MTDQETIVVLQNLANGIDPNSGEVFPTDSPYQRGNIIRALYSAVKAVEIAQSRQARRAKLPAQAGKPWDEKEDVSLREGFAAKKPAAELAAMQQRTPGAIRSR